MEAVVGKVIEYAEKAVTFCINMYQSRKDFDKNLETLERNVKQLSDIAIDMKTEQCGKNKKRKRQVESWFDEVNEVKKELRALKEEVTRGKKNGGALEKMNGRVGDLLEQSKHFGTLVHNMYQREECLLLAPQVHEETSKVNLEVIWTWLHDENVSSIGIYGMGGVGKTTLAMHIHNRLVNEHRYQVRWVTVSQGFSIKGLQDDLAKIVHLDLSNEEDEQRRAGQLNQAFIKRKNIVIILDDVWDRLCLEKLGDPLGVEGCRLILTSRSSEVCKKMGCQKLCEVKNLNTNDAWELFRRNLGCETMLSPDIEPVAKSMAGRCKGLPLGLITLARSMIGVTDIREWKNALKKFPDDMESGVFNVLQYSYDRLRDTNMQECFLYCALYPEDFDIDRDELISRFMMEGLVKGNSREEEFNQGHAILNKLVKLNLLEATYVYLGEDGVKMHDLLREVALRITNVKPKYMVRAGIGSQVPEEQDWAFDLDKVSFHNSQIKGIPDDMAPNCPTLSTLLLSRCDRLRSIPGPFFQYMNNLLVLNLSYNRDLMDLPRCILNLESLRALLLQGCRQLKSMPPLGKLKNLRVLDVSGTGIKEVPQGLENLVKIKYLGMGGTDLDELPKELLPKLSQLQYLYLPLRVNARVEDLASLELLEEFGGRFFDLHNLYEFMRNRRNNANDWWYDIIVNPESAPADDYYFGRERIKVRKVLFKHLTLEAVGGEAPTSIILPHGIQILQIDNCNGLSSCLVDNFLSRTTLSGLRVCKGTIASHTFSGLTMLFIEYCHKVKKLFPRAILQDLKNLEKLVVNCCVEMEEIIGREEEGSSQSSNPQITSTTSALPKLKRLYLDRLPKLKRICEGKLMCDSLEWMTFLKCPNLKRLPFYTPTTNGLPFPSLKNVSVKETWWETLEWDQPHIKTLLQPYILKC